MILWSSLKKNRLLLTRPTLHKRTFRTHVVEGRVRSLLVAVLLIAFASGVIQVSEARAAGTCTIRLRPDSVVQGTRICLADIADLSGNDEALVTRLARAPLGSVTQVRTLTRAEVLDLVRSLISDPQDVVMAGADFARVSLATRPPAAEEIDSLLKEHFASISQWRKEEIEIHSVDNLKSIEIPQGEVRLAITSRSLPSNFHSALLQVAAILDGRTVRSFWIKADVRVRARVVQVVEPIAYARAIQEGNLREAVSEIADPGSAYFRTCAEAIGATSRRNLNIGDLLKREWVKEDMFVHSGDTVKLVSQDGRVCITAMVRSLQSGRMGDRIKVRNLDSDRAVVAVVTGRGEARVAR